MKLTFVFCASVFCARHAWLHHNFQAFTSDDSLWVSGHNSPHCEISFFSALVEHHGPHSYPSNAMSRTFWQIENCFNSMLQQGVKNCSAGSHCDWVAIAEPHLLVR